MWHACARYMHVSNMHVQASQMRGKSEARRDSTADPALAALFRRYYWRRLSFVVQLIPLEFRWSLVPCAEILASMRHQVYSDIHAWRRRSHWGGLGMSSRISANRW